MNISSLHVLINFQLQRISVQQPFDKKSFLVDPKPPTQENEIFVKLKKQKINLIYFNYLENIIFSQEVRQFC